MKKKAIIIGMDGTRPDAMLAANTPNLDKLTLKGQYSWKAQTEIQTISGAAWTSLLTGVHSDKHHVVNNDFSPRVAAMETIFQIAKRQIPNVRCVAHSNWKPIITKIFEKDSLDIKSAGSDKKMTFRMVEDIRKDKGDLYFIQFDEIDGAGHSHTYGPESPKYIAKIEITDKYIGKIIKAIENRPKDEEWLIFVVSDHGGLGKSHGKPTLEELTIIFIVAGNMIQEKKELEGDEEEAPMIVDVVPTIAKFLDLTPLNYWDGTIRGF